MKKILILCAISICTTAVAKTINWYVDDQIYQTTTCESGDDIIPPTPPAKYGYTFRWWYDPTVIEGTWSQSGTPTPDNPIYPAFYQNGNLILRAVGTGDKTIADVYNPQTGMIIRRIGVKILNGTEQINWQQGAGTRIGWRFPRDSYFFSSDMPAYSAWLCSHFNAVNSASYNVPNQATRFQGNTVQIMFGISEETLGITSEATDSQMQTAWKNWLATQYANGTPVTVYYPLGTPVVENYMSLNP